VSEIEEELSALAAKMKNFAEILVLATREGRMTGYTPMTEIIWPAGTIYTHLECGNVLRGSDLSREVRKGLGGSEWLMTPLQHLLRSVRPGETPATNEALAQFVEVLRPYLLYPEKIPPAIQQKLW
jgi:hypothetical protein